MGGVEEVHCVKLPPPLDPIFSNIIAMTFLVYVRYAFISLYFIKGWEKAITLIKSCIYMIIWLL